MSELEREGEDTLSRLPEDPVEAAFELLRVYDRVYEYISYGVMQEFITHAKSNGPLHEISRWVLRWQQDPVARALKQCQERGSVSPELDSELAAEIVIDLLVRHNQRLTGPPAKLREFAHLKLRVELILEGWLCR